MQSRPTGTLADLDTVPDLRKTSCTTATKDTLRRAYKPPYISATNPRHVALFSQTDLAILWRDLHAVLSSPFKAATETSESDDAQCAVLLTHLTRLDESVLRDPREHEPKNPFHASTAAFGNVWTTRPMDADRISEDARSQNKSETGSKQESTMSGQIQMSRFDLGWRRKRRKGRHTPSAVAEVLDDDSDLEDYVKTAIVEEKPIDLPPEARPTETSFYATVAVPKAERSDRLVPDPMMLLRLAGRERQEAAKKTKREATLHDGRVLTVKRSKASAIATVDLLRG